MKHKYFAKNIFSGKITLDNADKNQSDLLTGFTDFQKGTKLRGIEKMKATRRYY